ncbi:MAG: hypothetical protein V1809_09000 [Planctomycetota bacterium]
MMILLMGFSQALFGFASLSYEKSTHFHSLEPWCIDYGVYQSLCPGVLGIIISMPFCLAYVILQNVLEGSVVARTGRLGILAATLFLLVGLLCAIAGLMEYHLSAVHHMPGSEDFMMLHDVLRRAAVIFAISIPLYIAGFWLGNVNIGKVDSKAEKSGV